MGALRLLPTLLLLLGSPMLSAQHATASDVLSGEQTYQSYCANCHGLVGNQIANVDLGHGVFRKPYSDEDLIDVLLRGIPGTPMPPTPNLNRTQAMQIVAYLRSRAVSKDVATGGDALRGRALFAGKGQCHACHQVQGEGSRVGPDLSRIGLLRTTNQLGAALLDPDAEVQPNNRWYGITTKKGERVSGRLLNQDAYSIQLLDEHEQLRSFNRQQLRSAQFLPSPMPSVRGLFNDRELADVVQYLASLRATSSTGAQVSAEALLNPASQPADWLSYSRDYSNQRHSPLTQINAGNAGKLTLQWVWQARSLEKFEATPLVVNGVMYTVQAPNDVVALDAATGRLFWTYSHQPAPARTCCGRVNRGLAMLGNTLFMGTVDAHLLAIDARSGTLLWDAVVADAAAQHSITMPPLVVKNKVIIGTAGGDMGIRGFVAAYDVKTGAQVWKFHTIPGPGEEGHSTWSGDSWQKGGAAIWNHGAFDAGSNLVYFGTGNPAPDWDGRTRLGDNLYSDSVIALDADTGALKWHYQFTPHDELDYDSTQVPVLADIPWHGKPRKVMLWANRNGLMYVLDRVTGEFLLGKPYVEVNWMDGFDAKGRPHRVPGMVPTPQGTLVRPHVHGAINWAPPAYSPRTGLFYVAHWEHSGIVAVEGQFPRSVGINARQTTMGDATLEPFFNNEDEARGVIRAYDPLTLKPVWEYVLGNITWGGTLSTAGNVVFGGGKDGHFVALDARSGRLLWKAALGGQVNAGAMTYAVEGRQYIAIAAGTALFTFALP
jgi:alcohol dehydrogenase (cytochrome c)